MTPRWVPIAFLIFGLVSVSLGTLMLAEGETAQGTIKLVLGFGWLLLAAFKGLRPAVKGDADLARDDLAVNSKFDGRT